MKAPKNKQKSAVNRRARQNKTSGSSVDSAIISQHHSGGNAFVLSHRGDLTQTALRFDLGNSRPPINYRSQIVWTEATYSDQISVSGVLGFTERNYQFTCNSSTTLSAMRTIYDQYCIYAAVVRVTPEIVAGTAYAGRLVTAIDYDNVNALGSFSAIANFSNALVETVVPGMSMERFVKPCVAPAVYDTGSATFTGYGTGRLWLDSANGTIPHFGLRFGVSNPVSPLAYTIDITTTLIVGFRNSI